jgi:hypothetical protein
MEQERCLKELQVSEQSHVILSGEIMEGQIFENLAE